MMRLVKNPFLKNGLNDIRMDEFAGAMLPLRCIYVACEDDFEDFISNFQKNIDSQDVFSLTLSKERGVGFKNDLNEEDCLLAISKEGNDEFVRQMVVIALTCNLKIFGLSEDFKSGLAMLSDNCLIIEEDFGSNVARFLKILRMKINGDSVDYSVAGKLISSKLNGIIVKINVKVGDEVKKGDKIFLIEAMKMEIDLESEFDGVVTEILVVEGDPVYIGDPLIRIKEH